MPEPGVGEQHALARRHRLAAERAGPGQAARRRRGRAARRAPGPRGAARRRAASRNVTEPAPGCRAADRSGCARWRRRPPGRRAPRPTGPSASSTSSGAAAPASQAEDHTVNVAEAQGTSVRLTSAPPRGTPTVRVNPTTHRHRWSRVKQGDAAAADGVSRAAAAVVAVEPRDAPPDPGPSAARTHDYRGAFGADGPAGRPQARRSRRSPPSAGLVVEDPASGFCGAVVRVGRPRGDPGGPARPPPGLPAAPRRVPGRGPARHAGRPPAGREQGRCARRRGR